MAKALVKFSVFSDLHYKKRMYAQSVDYLEQILLRAKDSGVDLILHGGDLCNDYARSPELLRALLENPHGLKVYGIFGNHELESNGNSVETVLPNLTNDPSVSWGDPDRQGGYYFFDCRGVRFVCTDTNYSYNAALGDFEHNRPGSWGPPGENTQKPSLGPKQLRWLESVLMDGAEKGLKCIVVSHVPFLPGLSCSVAFDNAAVREIFQKVNRLCPGTVVMAVNGDCHTNHIKEAEGILWFDVNTAGSGFWQPEKVEHYGDLTYSYTDYDEEGTPLNTCQRRLNDTWMGQNTWYFSRPLSAVVTVFDDGAVEIEGEQTQWMYGIVPETELDGVMPEISSYSYHPQ